MKLRKLSPLFFVVLCLTLILALFANIHNVEATSYYNWIKASEMETSTNHIEDSGLESGAFESGILYGNFSEGINAEVTGSMGTHTGSYALRLYYSGSGGYAWYNFTESILGADVANFTLWIYVGSTSYDPEVLIYYSDESNTDIDLDSCPASVWTQFALLGYIETGKYIIALKFDFSSGAGTNVIYDDIFLGVDDEYAQDQYEVDSYPWHIDGDFNVDYIGHNLIYGRNSQGSGYIGYSESTSAFVQEIDYASTNDIHFIDLWAYTAYTSSVAVKITIVYSDRTWDTKQVNITTVSTWEHLNFGSTWIDSNKYIIQIQIRLANYIEQYVNIDDVGLWSSIPAGNGRFTFNVSPAPTYKTAISFTCYQRVTHTFYAFVWDENQSLTESGTYNVITDYGSTSGSFSNGAFTFTLSARSSTATFSEQIIITITIGSEVMVFSITATWTYAGEGGEGEEGYITTPMLNFFVIFVIIFVPPLGLAFEFSARRVNPMLGFIGGLLLMTAIGFMSGITPPWFLFICVLVTILFMLAMFQRFAHGGVSA